MPSEPTAVVVAAFVAFVTVAALVGLAIRRVAIPYSVALVVVGLLLGVVLPEFELEVTPDLVLLVLLPGLVFEASLRIDLDMLRRTVGSVTLLAVPGVIVVAAVVAVGLMVGTGLPLELGFIVGAMVAATDPAAVVSAFKRLGTPRALTAVTEGESLFNDGTGLTLFGLAVAAVMTTVTAADVVETLLVTIVVSIVIGVVAGYLVSRVIGMVDDHLIELAFSVTAAYGTYLLADLFHESGVIATVIAGIVVGNYGRHRHISPRAAEALDVVWEFVAFLLTAFVFMIVGLAISLPQLAAALPWIAWGVIGALVGRAIVVYGLLGAAWHVRGPAGIPAVDRTGWLHVLNWSGLRGAVAVALALSLPADVPERVRLQEITFGIVLFTLLVQGVTIEPLIRRWLGGPQPTGLER